MNKLTLLLVLTAAGLALLFLDLMLKDPRPSTLSTGSERGAVVKNLKPKFLSIWSQASTTEKRILELAASVEQHDDEFCVVQEAKSRKIEVLPITPSDTPASLGASAVVGGTWTGVGDAQLFEARRMVVPDDVARKAADVRALGHTALIVGSEKRRVRRDRDRGRDSVGQLDHAEEGRRHHRAD